MGWVGAKAMSGIVLADEEKLLGVSANFGGGLECERALLPLRRLFWKLVENMRATDYLDGLARFELWFYFGGTILDYEGDSGPKRLATGRNPPRLIIDLRIARSDYVGKSQEAVRQDMADGIEACFELMLARAIKKKAVRDVSKLRADFAAVMKRFRTDPIPPFRPLGQKQYW